MMGVRDLAKLTAAASGVLVGVMLIPVLVMLVVLGQILWPCLFLIIPIIFTVFALISWATDALSVSGETSTR